MSERTKGCLPVCLPSLARFATPGHMHASTAHVVHILYCTYVNVCRAKEHRARDVASFSSSFSGSLFSSYSPLGTAVMSSSPRWKSCMGYVVCTYVCMRARLLLLATVATELASQPRHGHARTKCCFRGRPARLCVLCMGVVV